MNVLVLDELRKKSDEVLKAFSERKIKAELCNSSNDFMVAVSESEYDLVYINVEVWNKGHCAYNYFEIGQRLQSKPIIFYNVEEGMTPTLTGRNPHERDRVFYKPSDIESAIANT